MTSMDQNFHLTVSVERKIIDRLVMVVRKKCQTILVHVQLHVQCFRIVVCFRSSLLKVSRKDQYLFLWQLMQILKELEEEYGAEDAAESLQSACSTCCS